MSVNQITTTDKLTLEDLRPYVSVSIMKYSQSGNNADMLIKHLTSVIDEIIRKSFDKAGRLRRIETIEKKSIKGWITTGIWYSIKSTPIWVRKMPEARSIDDIRNHLVLILQKKDFFIVAATDNNIRKEIVTYSVADIQKYLGILPFKTIEKEKLSDAFFGQG